MLLTALPAMPDDCRALRSLLRIAARYIEKQFDGGNIGRSVMALRRHSHSYPVLPRNVSRSEIGVMSCLIQNARVVLQLLQRDNLSRSIRAHFLQLRGRILQNVSRAFVFSYDFVVDADARPFSGALLIPIASNNPTTESAPGSLPVFCALAMMPRSWELA